MLGSVFARSAGQRRFERECGDSTHKLAQLEYNSIYELCSKSSFASEPHNEKQSAMNGILERTLGILELLAQHGDGLELAAIADALNIPRSAVHRPVSYTHLDVYKRQSQWCAPTPQRQRSV